MPRPVLLSLCVLLHTLPFAAHGEEKRLACIADANISSYPSETELNYGASTRLRLKGIQMLAALQFDLGPVAGWRVESAKLFLCYAGNDRKLRTLGVSTIAAPWREGTGSGQKRAGEMCFAWREQGRVRWAGNQTDFTDISYSAGNTLSCYSSVEDEGDGWISVAVEPQIVQALIAGTSYGLAVSDEKGQTTANNDVFSREQSGRSSYLLVRGSPAPGGPPGQPGEISAAADAARSTFETGALRVRFSQAEGAFAYRLRYSDKGRISDVAQHRLPYASSGVVCEFSITELPGDVRLDWLEISAIGPTGSVGTARRLIGPSTACKKRPPALALPRLRWTRAGRKTGVTGPEFRVWAYPEGEKAHPVSGNLLEEVGLVKYGLTQSGDYREGNPVWDGSGIRLRAARNEIVGFNLVVEAAGQKLAGCTIRLDGILRSGSGARLDVRPSLFRAWYVKDREWQPEIAVPLKGSITIPAADNAVPGQKNQAIAIDLLVPKTTRPGVYRGAIKVSAGGQRAEVPVELTVNSLALPDMLGFDISLNAYGTVGHHFGVDDHTPVYRAIELEYHRMAHIHRTTLAILGYSHGGTVSTNYAPRVAGEGDRAQVSDWSSWDAQFGPYLDGSAFADLPRAGVPLSHFYLPFHEAWPADIRKHYRYAPRTGDYPAMIVEHALSAPPIEEAMAPEFAAEFVSVMHEVDRHLREKGWNRTEFHFYLNNKNYYKDPKQGGRGTSWWLLDEPNYRDDWLALAYFGRLFRQATEGKGNIRYREDISRPEWQRDYVLGLFDLMVVGGVFFQKQPLLRELKRAEGVRYWTYGTANEVRSSSLELEAWALVSWLNGADGMVPWNSVGGESNFVEADATALLLPGTRFGMAGPVASLRLKALRRAQQDVEYLLLLSRAKGWDRDQVGAALARIVDIAAFFRQSTTDDAGSYRFGSLSAETFDAMRRAVAQAAAGEKGARSERPSRTTDRIRKLPLSARRR